MQQKTWRGGGFGSSKGKERDSRRRVRRYVAGEGGVSNPAFLLLFLIYQSIRACLQKLISGGSVFLLALPLRRPGLVNLLGRPLPQPLMGGLPIVKSKVRTDPAFRFPHIFIIVQVNLLVLYASPQALDENVVEESPPTIHADPDPGRFQLLRKTWTRILRSLIAVEDLRPGPSQSLLENL